MVKTTDKQEKTERTNKYQVERYMNTVGLKAFEAIHRATWRNIINPT